MMGIWDAKQIREIVFHVCGLASLKCQDLV